MDDLISRQDAVSRFSDLLMVELKGKRFPTWDEVYNAMQDVPSADVQPVRHGYWIESDTDGFVCSVCRSGYRNQPTLMGKPMFEYCPVCGARMDGEQDG